MKIYHDEGFWMHQKIGMWHLDCIINEFLDRQERVVITVWITECSKWPSNGLVWR